MKKTSFIQLAILSTLLLIVYWPTFLWMRARFIEANSYYSHGFLVPFIVGFLIWNKRKELSNIKVKPLSAGLLIIIPSLLVHLLAYKWKINFVSGFSFLITLYGATLYLYGKGITKQLALPFCFLIFMIPLPQVLIIHISFNMKMFAAHIATSAINLMGISAAREGSIVYLPNTSVMVGDPCSGLRSLISLTALGALYAYLINLTTIKKIILFFTSIPLALIANIIRIILILVVAFVYGSDIATGKFHDFSGFLLFLIALIGLIIAGKILSWKKEQSTS